MGCFSRSVLPADTLIQKSHSIVSLSRGASFENGHHDCRCCPLHVFVVKQLAAPPPHIRQLPCQCLVLKTSPLVALQLRTRSPIQTVRPYIESTYSPTQWVPHPLVIASI